jgi:hypothetical protein
MIITINKKENIMNKNGTKLKKYGERKTHRKNITNHYRKNKQSYFYMIKESQTTL